jgi:Bacterial regulatory proteins, tetR family
LHSPFAVLLVSASYRIDHLIYFTFRFMIKRYLVSIEFTLRSVKLSSMKKNVLATARKGRPPSEMAASHAAIMDAVYTLLQEKSVRDLTIEEVAKRARVGKPTLYKWWPTKATLVLAMLCERMAPNLEKPTVLTAEESLPSGAALDRRLQRAVWQDRGRADRRGLERASYTSGVLRPMG